MGLTLVRLLRGARPGGAGGGIGFQIPASSLFVVTFAVNAIARYIVNRRAEFSGAN